MYRSVFGEHNKPLGCCPLQIGHRKEFSGDGLPLLTTNKATSDESETKNSLKSKHEVAL
jgi:hypothetical protein